MNVPGWVYAALCFWANRSPDEVQIIKSGTAMTIWRNGVKVGTVVVNMTTDETS